MPGYRGLPGFGNSQGHLAHSNRGPADQWGAVRQAPGAGPFRQAGFPPDHPGEPQHRRKPAPSLFPQAPNPEAAACDLVRRVGLYGPVFGVCPAVHPVLEPGGGEFQDLPVFRDRRGGGCLSVAEYGPLPGYGPRFRYLWPGHGLRSCSEGALRQSPLNFEPEHHSFDPFGHQDSGYGPGTGLAAGGQAPVRKAPVAESHPGTECRFRSCYGNAESKST